MVGYPRIFNGEDCNAAAPGSRPTEESRLNATADLLNSKTSAARPRPGASPSPTRPAAFIGHAVCDGVEWLNGLSNPVSETYHPNRPGHASGYTPMVSPSLVGTAYTASAATLTKAARAPRIASRHSSAGTPPRTPRSHRRSSWPPT